MVMDNESNVVLTDMLEIHFFELQKYEMSAEDPEKIWISFLNDPNSNIFQRCADLPNEVVQAR